MHGCHKVGITIEGDFISVLSHNDQNTKIGGEEYNKKVQKNKQTNTKIAAAKMEELVVWEPFRRRVRTTRRLGKASQQWEATESAGITGGWCGKWRRVLSEFVDALHLPWPKANPN
jgi:hypothetical protein